MLAAQQNATLDAYPLCGQEIKRLRDEKTLPGILVVLHKACTTMLSRVAQPPLPRTEDRRLTYYGVSLTLTRTLAPTLTRSPKRGPTPTPNQAGATPTVTTSTTCTLAYQHSVGCAQLCPRTTRPLAAASASRCRRVAMWAWGKLLTAATAYYCYTLLLYFTIAIEYFTIAMLSYCYTLLCLYEYVTMSVLDPGHTKEWPSSLGGGGFTASTCRRAVCGRVDGTR